MLSVVGEYTTGCRKTIMSTPSTSCVVIAVVIFATTSSSPLFVWSVVDAARVLSQPDRIYLTRAVPGRLDCPADANPPVTLVAWTKDGRPVQVARRINSDSDSSISERPALKTSATGYIASDSFRVSLAGDGALLFTTVSSEDAGRYACTPHSSLGVGQSSVSVQVLVKGTTRSLYTVRSWKNNNFARKK